MIPLEASRDSGFRITRARAQAGILEEVVGGLTPDSQESRIIEAAKLMKRIDIVVEDLKFQANNNRGKNLYPVDEDKRFGLHDACGEILGIIAEERNRSKES